ncbi:hypothetical protein [Actinacidiphila acididurans]|uniref:Uncharacterized protein n=1 Tax=Actinacidiphila acididurans TaxID=2784346 RepID=A0ABS2U0Y6_9ACTN|nr:hypothetical protein [Actinacidiphila acididurans]MBM9509268.1 hypothetical protein [Actinacidiphila acididurans]
MIGEPEMSDEPGGDLPGDALGESDGPLATTAAVRKPRPWLWAVGGIAVASAVWAAVLHGAGGTGVDLHGYHLGGNPCGGPALKPLQDAVGAREGFSASDAMVSKGPALDKVSCVLNAMAPAGDGWTTTYTISVDVELHKKTDPRAEFENTRHAQVSRLPGAQYGNVMVALATSGFTSAADVHPVAGVGDEAYLVEPQPFDQSLKVLRGGAVLSLQITDYRSWNGPGGSPADGSALPRQPDFTRLRPAMTTAMRRLMTSLSS